MIAAFEASIPQLAIHRTGNKLLNETLVLADKLFIPSSDELAQALMRYFTYPFEKTNELYRLYHSTGNLSLNEIAHFAGKIFAEQEEFLETSRQMATYLYECSNNPRIKSGEVYIAHFRDLQIEGELLEAIGIFKSESKEPFLKVVNEQGAYDVVFEPEAINLKKLDKGCIIFNTEAEQGYKVAVVDQTNRNTEAVYWVDDFLKLKIRNDDYTQTNNVLGVYKQFITQQVDEVFEVSKADKIDLLNRSITYFKANDQFDMEAFSNEVIVHPDGIREFRKFKEQYEQEMGAPIEDGFTINGAALKKQARAYKSVLKLDRNFHIYIHGDRDLIEKGFDEEKRMSFYKVYFKEEQ